MKPMDTRFSPEPDDDWLDQALRRQAEAMPDWLPDEGFSDRLMQRLPPGRRRSMRWWPVIGGLLGALTMICLDQRWQALPVLIQRIGHPGVALAIGMLLLPLLLTSAVLLLLAPGSD